MREDKGKKTYKLFLKGLDCGKLKLNIGSEMCALSWCYVMLGNTLLINEELFLKVFEGNYIDIVTFTNILRRSIADIANLDLGIDV